MTYAEVVKRKIEELKGEYEQKAKVFFSHSQDYKEVLELNRQDMYP